MAGVGECIEAQADFESSIVSSVSELKLLEVDFLDSLAIMACPPVCSLLWETKRPASCPLSFNVSTTGVTLSLRGGPPKEIVLLFEFLRSSNLCSVSIWSKGSICKIPEGMRGSDGTDDLRFGTPCTPGGAGNRREIFSWTVILRVSFGRSLSNREAVVGNADGDIVGTSLRWVGFSEALGTIADVDFCRVWLGER
jgi:hypothetical protein